MLAGMTIACDVTVFENMSKQRKQQENKKKSISQELKLIKMLDETITVIRSVKDITYETICEKTTIKIDFQFKFVKFKLFSLSLKNSYGRKLNQLN